MQLARKKSFFNILKRQFASSNLVSREIEKIKEMYDPSQTNQLADSLTLVDSKDNIMGSVSKVEGHLKSILMQEGALPHRAFSLFHFNSKNELLLQQRSKKKITYPLMWSNTCCSHNAHIPYELEVNPNYIGMRRAVIRRAKFELGIKELTEDDIKIGCKILYFAEACQTFAEYELDYIAFSKGDIDLSNINPDEIESIHYVAFNDLEDFIQERKEVYKEEMTPWFNLIRKDKLMRWWETLILQNKFPNESDQIESYMQIEKGNKQ